LNFIEGFQHVSPVEDFPVEKWNSIIAVLLSAPFHLIRLLVPEMRRRGWGRIINVASVHSVRASPFKAAYVSAKHGLAGLNKVNIMNHSILYSSLILHKVQFMYLYSLVYSIEL